MKDFRKFMGAAIMNKSGNTFNENGSFQEYERRKREIIALNLSPEEYQEAIKRLATELGI